VIRSSTQRWMLSLLLATASCTAPFLEEPPRPDPPSSGGSGGSIPDPVERAAPCPGTYYCEAVQSLDLGWCIIDEQELVPVQCPTGCARPFGDDPEALCIGGLGGAGGWGGAGGLGGAAGAARW